jgi:phosphoribosyl-dephospho-CoA transferase
VSDALAAGRETCWTRHELLLVAPSDWARALPQNLDLAARSLLTFWSDRGWPVIVRRRTEKEQLNSVPVGVPLPPVAGKQRIALSIPQSAVVRRQWPPSLRTVRQIAEPSWRRTIDALVSLGVRLGIAPAAFGSLLWQYRTGLQYLSHQSDLDVLWHAHSDCDLAALLAAIAVIEQNAPMRIDGEVVFADGGAVNWRELYLALNGSRSSEVLVKSIGGVALADVSKLTKLRRAA